MIIGQILQMDKISLCQMPVYNKGNDCYQKKGLKKDKGL